MHPYERRLDEYTEGERQAWASFIAACLRSDGVSAEDRVCITANEMYARHLSGALQDHGIKTVAFALEDRPTPDQLQ